MVPVFLPRFLLLVALFRAVYALEIYYVNPDDDNSSCPTNHICETIDYYAVNFTNEHFTNHRLFYFLPGNHLLSYSWNILDFTNLTLQGIGEMEEGLDETIMESQVIIECLDGVNIIVENCENITIANLTLRECGGNESTAQGLYINNATSVILDYTSIQYSPGIALAINNVTSTEIDHSSFYRNSLHSVSNQTKAVDVVLTSGTFIMTNTNITYNSFIGINFQLVITTDTDSFEAHSTITIQLETVMISHNRYQNMIINTNNTHYNLSIHNAVITHGLRGVAILQNSTAPSGTIVYTPHISITNSVISDNQLSGIETILYGLANAIFHLNSSLIQRNYGIFGSALRIIMKRGDIQDISNLFKVLLHNVTINSNKINHTYAQQHQVTQSFAVTVEIFSNRNVTVSNCTFSNNEGSGLGLLDTHVSFLGDNWFINNTGYNGGGIFMVSDSYLFLSQESHIYFIKNYAKGRGGAINIAQIVLALVSSNDVILTFCFYQFYSHRSDSHIYFHFENNTADIAGSVVYGGAADNCLINGALSTSDLLSSISTFIHQTGYSLISSDARDVCFCNNSMPICHQKTLHSLETIPGQSVSFDIIVVGQNNNSTTGVVSVFDHETRVNHNISLAKCTKLTHPIKVYDSSQISINLSITLNSASTQTNFVPIPLTLQVDIENCPLGFELQDVCVCSKEINDIAVNCNSTTNQVTRHGPYWIANYNDCLLIYNECPFDYCIPTSVTLLLNDSDLQCALNRSNLLCGECQEGLSLMLGSNRCSQCTNGYIALIIPFALAGIVLVVILIVLNLTVSVGTINGLLFYANVLKIYQPFFSGLQNIPVLGQFISWLNLDLGIETCFIAGMNSCTKIGLQFVFPFYLGILIILIVSLSYRSSKISSIIGNNSVPLLCTLLLLSYTKLLLAVISIYSFASISCVGRIWYIDPTIPYYGGCHLTLVIIALPIILCLFVPFTLFLLLFPLWEVSRSKWTYGTTLYLKLKPFYDAYSGPHSTQLRFWPGLLILARIVLAITIATAPGFIAPVSVLLAIIACIIVTLSFGKVYKEGSYLHILDISYLLCLLIIIYIVFGTRKENNTFLTYNQAKIGVGFMFSISFVTFIGIIIYRIYSLPWIKKLYAKLKSKPETFRVIFNKTDSVTLINSIRKEKKPAIVTTTDVGMYREPLIDSDVY